MLTLVAFVGCSQHGTQPVPATDTDEAAVTTCVEGWLKAQEDARPGAEYWDEFVHTSFDDPSLGEHFQVIKKGYEAVAWFREHEGERFVKPQSTVAIVKTLNAVRSWKILRVDVNVVEADMLAKWQRENSAVTVARIDSSNNSGIRITQNWRVELYKNKRRWGIFDVGKSR
jgi:hypothetical protein